MTTEQVHTTVLSILKEYGFATTVALASLYVGRQDIILPMVESHRTFLKEVAATQREIGQAISEQTRLLYALQSQMTDKPPAGKP